MPETKQQDFSHATVSPELYRLCDFSYLRGACGAPGFRRGRGSLTNLGLLADDHCLGLAARRRTVPGSMNRDSKCVYTRPAERPSDHGAT